MKKYITIAALLAAGTACANAETTTWEPLKQELSGDAIGAAVANRAKPTQDTTEGTLTYAQGNWSRGYAKVDMDDITLKNVGDTLTVSMTFNLTDVDPQIAVGTLLGSTTTGNLDISMGDGIYNGGAIQAGTSSKQSNFYHFTGTGDSPDIGTYIDTSLLRGIEFDVDNEGVCKDVTFTTKIEWNEEKNGFVASVSVSGCKNTENTQDHTSTATFDLGQEYTFAGLIFSFDGDNNAFTTTVSNVSVSATIVPEPSAFGLLAGIGALALVASRRRRK